MMTENPFNLSADVRARANEAVAPMLFAGALDAPKVDISKAKISLEKLGIPANGKALIVVAYNGCGTHDFSTLQKAATENGAKLYVIYGNPNDPAATQKNKDKLSVGVTEGGKSRTLNAKIILPTNGTANLSTDEIRNLAADLGLTTQIGAGGVRGTNGSALYDNGVFQGLIPNTQTRLIPITKTAFVPEKRSAIALG